MVSVAALVALGLVLTPGPNMIYLVSRSVTQGRRAGLVSLLGVAAGFGVYLLAAVAGIAALFALVPALYTAVKLAGAAYLLWLAWQTVRPGGDPPFEPTPLPEDRARRLFAMGFLTNLLNPKIAILYVSLLPQFVDPARGGVAAQSLVLGLTQITIALTLNAAIVFTAGSVASFLGRRPLWLRAQRYLMGTVLAGLALRIAADRSHATAARDVSGHPGPCEAFYVAAALSARASIRRVREPARFHFSASAITASGSRGALGSVGSSWGIGTSRATRTTGAAAARYGPASTSFVRSPGAKPASGSSSAARIPSRLPCRFTRRAAVLSPTPGTPGNPSLGSPRSVAKSAYAAAGTPHRRRIAASSSTSSLATPLPV